MDQPLSDLCGLCHAEQPKYRCPRCKAKTCSLQCYKRHQQRASCSGKRDPAAYIKKTQLATPAGIDQDYNYLKGIERTIDDVSRDVQQRGFGVETRKSKVATRGWHRDSVLQRYLTENRVTVQHAPEGLSRQRNNETRVTKSGNVVWTIEWADAFGVLGVQNDFPASKSIGELYAEFRTRKYNAEKRRLNLEKPETNQRGSKRKRMQDPTVAPTADAGLLAQEGRSLHSLNKEESPLLAKSGGFEASTASDPVTLKEEVYHGTDAHQTQAEAQSDCSFPPVHFILEDKITQDASGGLSELSTVRSVTLPTELDPTPHCYYYLLKPGTAGPNRVLVPLGLQASLTESLRDQVVQEYPTIHVLPNPPKALPVGFVLEAEYVKTTKRESNISRASNVSNACVDAAKNGRSSESTTAGADVKVDSAAGKLNENEILDMLKRNRMR